jgi:hypothetical protein
MVDWLWLAGRRGWVFGTALRCTGSPSWPWVLQYRSTAGWLCERIDSIVSIREEALILFRAAG